jgi:small-conductance mechanosensitive channel
MRIRSNKQEEPEQEENAVLTYTKTTYRQFSDYVAFRDDDPLWMLVYKIVLRLFGILFALLISPFALLGLIAAFIMAG